MLTKYIQAAMRRARYEIIDDDSSYYGHIPRFKGLWANSKTLEGCREELEDALQSWLLFALTHGIPVPTVDRIRLSHDKVA